MKASAQSSRSFFCMGATYTCNNFFLASKVFVHLLGKVPPSMGLTHMRSMCVGVAETGHREFSLCADESKDFRQPSPVGEGVSHRLTDEVSFKKRLKILCVYRAFGHSKAR